MGHCQLDSALAFNWAEKMGMTCVMNLSAVSNDKPGDMLVISDPKIDAVINSGRNYDLHHPRVERVIGEGANVPSLMGNRCERAVYTYYEFCLSGNLVTTG